MTHCGCRQPLMYHVVLTDSPQLAEFIFYCLGDADSVPQSMDDLVNHEVFRELIKQV